MDEIIRATERLSLVAGNESVANPCPTETLHVIGGISNGSRKMEMYNPVSGMSNITKNMPSERKYFATVVVRGKLYMIGGRKGQGEPLDTVECFDGFKWTTLGERLFKDRSEFGAAVVNDTIYIIGGFGDSSRTSESFNPITNEHKVLENLHQGRWGHGVVALRNSVYVLGGHRSNRYFANVERLDVTTIPVRSRWKTNVTAMQRRRAYFGVATSDDRFIYAVGGFGGVWNSTVYTRMDSVERYDADTDQWTLLTDLPSPRSNVAACWMNSKLVAVGGIDDGKRRLKDILQYDPESGEWRLIGNMVFNRFAHCVAVC